MSPALDKKFETILDRERAQAKTIACAVLKAAPLSVWEVLIPVIFILNFMRLKHRREVFTLNFMFTKKLALEAALSMKKKGRSRGEALARIEDETRSILGPATEGVYCDEIRRRQIKEIDLLIDHYCSLLEAEGDAYASLVVSAYPSKQKYTTFLEQLRAAEKEVVAAARRTLGDRTDTQALSRMEQATERLRTAEVENIFGTGAGQIYAH